MIINPNNLTTSNSLPSATARLQKSNAPSPANDPVATSPNSLADQMQVSSQNLAAAVSPLEGSAAVQAAIQAARKQFMMQPNIAMLAQANQMPQNALRLLQ